MFAIKSGDGEWMRGDGEGFDSITRNGDMSMLVFESRGEAEKFTSERKDEWHDMTIIELIER